MAAGKKTAVEFEEIIKTDRQRRKNEALAQEIFGKGKRTSAPGAGVGPRKPGTGPSLASRIGVSKQRSTSITRVPTLGKQKRNPPAASNVNAEWTHDLFSENSTAAPGPQQNGGSKATRISKEAQLYSAINATTSTTTKNNQFNIVGNSKPAIGLSIRGIAGPCVVVAENFAPGTTAEDIESAMAPYGGPILKCRLVQTTTTVIAEITFDTREGADKVISRFNNQTADGLILSLYHKSGTLSDVARPNAVPPTGPRADLMKSRSSESRSLDRYSRYEQPDIGRDHKYEREDVTDGSYGFEDRMDTEDRDEQKGRGRGGLYSDNMVSNRGDRGGGRGERREGGRGYDRGIRRGFR